VHWHDITNNFIQLYDPWNSGHDFSIEEISPYITIKFEYTIRSYYPNDTKSYNKTYYNIRKCEEHDFGLHDYD